MENYRHGKDIAYVEYSLCIPNGAFLTGMDLRCSYSGWCYTDTAHPLQHLRKMGGYERTRESNTDGQQPPYNSHKVTMYWTVQAHWPSGCPSPLRPFICLCTLNMFMGVKQFCTPRSIRNFYNPENIFSVYKMPSNGLTNQVSKRFLSRYHYLSICHRYCA